MIFNLPEKYINEIKQILKLHPEIEKAIIYGSRAMGNSKNGSDIDLALLGDISYQTLTKLKTQLEDGTLIPYYFDLTLYNTITEPKLKEHIDQFGKIFYLK